MGESQVGSFAHWWRKNVYDVSLKSDVESGRQGKGSESYGALLTSRLCEVSSGTKCAPPPPNLESRK